jgi:HIV Tat-specific factor 1
MLEIKEDIREECAKLGEVTNVVLFDKEDAGVASVRFATSEAANACVRVSLRAIRRSTLTSS